MSPTLSATLKRKNKLLALRRRMRTSGFGVHSPFAFRFLRGVVKCRHAYYAYDEIDRMSGDRKLMRLIFRVAQRFDCRRIAVETSLLPDVGRALSLVRSGMVVGRGVADAELIVADSGISAEICRECLEREGVVVLIGLKRKRGEARDLLEALDGAGMSFADGSTAIIVGDKRLPRQHFEVCLR